jgi:hypothetical protein
MLVAVMPVLLEKVDIILGTRWSKLTRTKQSLYHFHFQL